MRHEALPKVNYSEEQLRGLRKRRSPDKVLASDLIMRILRMAVDRALGIDMVDHRPVEDLTAEIGERVKPVCESDR